MRYAFLVAIRTTPRSESRIALLTGISTTYSAITLAEAEAFTCFGVSNIVHAHLLRNTNSFVDKVALEVELHWHWMTRFLLVHVRDLFGRLR